MISRWNDLKLKAIEMRVNGNSISGIENILKIPRSTLSGWFKGIVLTKDQKLFLKTSRLVALKSARLSANAWHNKQKQKRIKLVNNQAELVISNLDSTNKSIQELALAMLYLGEGFKGDRELGVGNSDPLILKFFIKVIENNFNISRNQINCELHLRADQNPETLKLYWSKQLGVPLACFKYVSFDKRTFGYPTRRGYNGVCSLRFGNIAIQRRLIYIATKFCEKIISQGG